MKRSVRTHMEEECLFFVAMSRARTYLRLYQPQFQANGNKRSSVRIARQAFPRSFILETANPPVIALAARRADGRSPS